MDNNIGIVGRALALISFVYLLTRSTLRWITLSFASKIEGKNFLNPLSREAKERVGKRSDAGVSQRSAFITTAQFAAFISKALLTGFRIFINHSHIFSLLLHTFVPIQVLYFISSSTGIGFT